MIAKEVYTNPQLSSTATVTLTVIDVNDNSPTFDLNIYSATVSELAPVGTVIVTVTANDRDSGKFGLNGITYNLEGDGSEKFNVDRRNGVVTVAPCASPGTAECLDYETKNDYNIFLEVIYIVLVFC